jgi:hypothetical protein
VPEVQSNLRRVDSIRTIRTGSNLAGNTAGRITIPETLLATADEVIQ